MDFMLMKYRAFIIGGLITEAEQIKERQLMVADDPAMLEVKFAQAKAEAYAKRQRLATPIGVIRLFAT
jgi:hypothetical protein